MNCRVINQCILTPHHLANQTCGKHANICVKACVSPMKCKHNIAFTVKLSGKAMNTLSQQNSYCQQPIYLSLVSDISNHISTEEDIIMTLLDTYKTHLASLTQLSFAICLHLCFVTDSGTMLTHPNFLWWKPAPKKWKAGKAQLELITLTMAQFHFSRPISGATDPALTLPGAYTTDT